MKRTAYHKSSGLYYLHSDGSKAVCLTEKEKFKTVPLSEIKFLDELAPIVSTVFSQLIREVLTPEELAEVVRLNKAESPDVCHTHNFIDANIYMNEAFKKILKRSVKPQSWIDCDLWNMAWSISKQHNFKN